MQGLFDSTIAVAANVTGFLDAPVAFEGQALYDFELNVANQVALSLEDSAFGAFKVINVTDVATVEVPFNLWFPVTALFTVFSSGAAEATFSNSGLITGISVPDGAVLEAASGELVFRDGQFQYAAVAAIPEPASILLLLAGLLVLASRRLRIRSH